jgi:hypothetical protein
MKVSTESKFFSGKPLISLFCTIYGAENVENSPFLRNLPTGQVDNSILKVIVGRFSDSQVSADDLLGASDHLVEGEGGGIEDHGIGSRLER